MTDIDVHRVSRGRVDRRSRHWVQFPALLAPVALIGGWTVAAWVQPDTYSSVSATISDLAATTAHLRIIMTVGLLVNGGCLVALAYGLSTLRRRARALIAVAGLASAAVAGVPLPQGGGLHALFAAIAFLTLALWPVVTIGHDGRFRTLKSAAAWTATGVFSALLLLVALAPNLAGVGGITERLLAGGEVLWVAIVAIEISRRSR